MLNQIIEFLKNFGTLIDLAVLLSIFGYFTTLYRAKNDAAMEQQNARIKLLEQQLQIQGGFTVEKTAERFRSLKEYYETHLKDWYEKSIEALKQEHEQAVQQKEETYQAKLAEEIRIRTELKEKFDVYSDQSNANSNTYLVSPETFAGTYSVSGINPGLFPGFRGKPYFGKLMIAQDGDTYKLSWIIESAKPTQVFSGRGVLTRNILSVMFYATHPPTDKNLVGLICYEILGDEILRGTWTGWSVDVVGTEELRRID